MESLRRTRIARVYAAECCYPLVRLFSIWIAAPPSICSANQLQLEMDRYYEDLSTLKSTLAFSSARRFQQYDLPLAPDWMLMVIDM